MKKIVIEMTDDIYKRFTRDVSTIDSYTISKLKQAFKNSKPLDDVIEEKLKKIRKSFIDKAPKYSDGEVAREAYWIVTLDELLEIIDGKVNEVKDEINI